MTHLTPSHFLAIALTAACIAMSPQSASAQTDLTQEITIETDFTPTEQRADKLNVLPQTVKPQTEHADISYSDWAAPTEVKPTAPLMMPYPYLTSCPTDSTRGFARIAIGTQLNILGDIAYRVLDTKQAQATLWFRHRSTWIGHNNSDNLPDDIDNPKQQINDNSLGIDIQHSVYQGTLSASAMYHFDRYNYITGEDLPKQTVNEALMKIAWESRRKSNGTNYSLGLTYNYFGLSKGLESDDDGNTLDASSDHHLTIAGNVEAPYNDIGIGANAAIDYLARSVNGDSHSAAILTLAPYIRYNDNEISAKIGIIANISVNDDAVFRLAPQVDASARLSDRVFLYIDATGGKHFSTLTQIYHLDRYLNPNQKFSSTYSPLDGEVGLKFGPFTGFHAKIYCGYGIFKDIATPMLITDDTTGLICLTTATQYTATDLKGLKLGAEIGYRHSSVAQITLKAQYAPQDDDDGYFTGIDRAQATANAILTINPIEPLSITADYSLRAHRRAYSADYLTKADLGNASNLSLLAAYQITPTVAATAQAHNLLNKTWDTSFAIAHQRMAVLIGLTAKF